MEITPFTLFSPCQWMSILAILWVSMQLTMIFILFQFICWWADALPSPCWRAGQKQRQKNNASPDMNITNHKNISTLARRICSRLGFTLHFAGWRSISFTIQIHVEEVNLFAYSPGDLSCTNIAKLLKLRSVFVKQPQSLASAEPSNSQESMITRLEFTRKLWSVSQNIAALVNRSQSICNTAPMHITQQRMKCKHGWSRGKCRMSKHAEKSIRRPAGLKNALLLVLNGRKELWATGSAASRCA